MARRIALPSFILWTSPTSISGGALSDGLGTSGKTSRSRTRDLRCCAAQDLSKTSIPCSTARVLGCALATVFNVAIFALLSVFCLLLRTGGLLTLDFHED
jgi:hypothetical protein